MCNVKKKSFIFKAAKPGTPGRRAVRNLTDDRIIRAMFAALSALHQVKFQPRHRTWMNAKRALGGPDLKILRYAVEHEITSR